MVNGSFQLFFLDFYLNPIWLFMINLPKISLQIVPDQIALYLVSDCSSRYLIGVRKLFLLKNRIQLDSGGKREYTDNAKMILSMHGECSGSVEKCLTRDRGTVGLSLTSVSALWSLSKTHLS